ncbi:hypothetical protein BAE44_0018562 [Dichanthelium oligosanthes]|uniref:BZIP domain-containing protein n=1 Tax=Dichanthelium oligosanthes TaxID=888268 RepID=A0A1E5V5I0_9POAL|nr:hypothetical protein BAE44_0018562 [Dichanthelium oligosanthes]
MSDDQQRMRSGGGQRQCRRRGITPEVELGAALALADMAGSSVGLGPAAERATARAKVRPAVVQLHTAAGAEEAMTDDDEMAGTRLSLQLGRVGIQSSSSSSAGRTSRQQPTTPAPAAAATGTQGPRPRHMLTEGEKAAKRLRRVLANRESARQTILRRQAVRDELARKVADLSSENETIKKVSQI